MPSFRAAIGVACLSLMAGRANAEPTASSALIAALAGDWSGVMRAEVPPEVEEFPWRMSCAPVALNSGVLCHSGGTASIGALAQTCLIAFASEEQAVHLMCVSSMGEVHDHRGSYADGAIRFEPLRGFMSGESVEERVEYDVTEAGGLRTVSVMQAAGRPEMRFTFTAAKENVGDQP